MFHIAQLSFACTEITRIAGRIYTAGYLKSPPCWIYELQQLNI